jgi:hypothetical protein
VTLGLLVGLLLAQSQVEDTETVDGFTADGRFAVVTRVSTQLFSSGTTRHVHAAERGVAAEPIFVWDEEKKDEAAAARAWLAEHPLTQKVLSGRTSPDERSTATAVLELAPQVPSRWTRDKRWILVVATGKQRRTVATLTSNGTVGWSEDSKWVTINWEPFTFTQGLMRGAEEQVECLHVAVVPVPDSNQPSGEWDAAKNTPITVRWLADGFVVEHEVGSWTEPAKPAFSRFDLFNQGGVSTTSPGDGGVVLTSSLTAPDKSVLKVAYNPGSLTWSDDTFKLGNSSVTATIERDKQSWPVPVSRSMTYLEVYWSPDNRRALLHGSKYFEGWRVVPGAFPRVQVLYPPKAPLDQPTILKVDALAAQVGLVVSFAGEAKKARPASVIYADKGFEKQAAALAALLPGGATVDKLSWKTSASLVIAVGQSFTDASNGAPH